MSGDNKKIKKGTLWVVVGVFILVLIAFGVVGFFYYKTLKEFDLTKAELINVKMELLNTKSALERAEANAQNLSQNLETEKYKNSLFEGQIKEIASTVGTLDKLSKTDKELLQKYSKVYFLNEHYIPDGLSFIPGEFIHEKDKNIEIHSKVLPYFLNLLNEAKKGGIELRVISGFRSFSKQSILKNGYVMSYGNGANKFSADQGYSEHQLGTTIDFTTIELGSNFTAFAKSEAYKWLKENAYKYGFVLSYPENNTYYQFEPWHWRFVGKNLANTLHEEKWSFYGMDQNKIDAYLINIFD